MTLEIACFNLESAIIAQRAGANRIELCEDYNSGGITPHREVIKEALRKIEIPVFVMIRPRSGNFIYTEAEAEQMRNDIFFCAEEGASGVVFGALTKDGNVDTKLCSELVQIASPMNATFHRAFDEAVNSLNALEDVISCGFHRILTSGKKSSALDGCEEIAALIQSAKNRITIMPGGSIRSNNINEIAAYTRAKEFHSAALNTATMVADEAEIKKLKAALS